MGSVAMDQAGNLALGFSASSATIIPQIRYAGRRSTDPLNTLTGESDAFDGTGSQTGTSNRWGDYSAMTVDPWTTALSGTPRNTIPLPMSVSTGAPASGTSSLRAAAAAAERRRRRRRPAHPRRRLRQLQRRQRGRLRARPASRLVAISPPLGSASLVPFIQPTGSFMPWAGGTPVMSSSLTHLNTTR